MGERFFKFLSEPIMTFLSMLFLVISVFCTVFKINAPLDFAIFTILISGSPIYFEALKELILHKKMTASLHIAIAMTAAIFTKELLAAAEIAIIMAFGEILAELTITKAKQGITKLLNLVPKNARKIQNSTERIVPAETIQKGDIIRVLTGENIPLDGRIVSGETSVNQAVMTGEAIPVEKQAGDEVYSGSTNCYGVIEIEVTREYENSSIQKMVNLVKEAENKKGAAQKIIDKCSLFIIPAACVLALIVYLITGEISRAVTILVVFCPCSLLLATPISIIAGIGHAARYGNIIKSGAALETLGKCSVIAFDKTGTLTKGNLSVMEVRSFGDIPCEDVLYFAASSELKSEHPIGRAIVELAIARNFKLKEPVDFKMLPGKGVYAKLDGKRVLVGNEKFMENGQISLTGEMKKVINSRRLEGKVVLIVALEGAACGIVSLGDTIRETSIPALNALSPTRTILLTGDNSLTANYFAKKSGINSAYSNLMPKEKADIIKTIQAGGKTVCMVGDGVNDALALKSADVGISMGTFGSDIAIENSDIIITGDDLTKIPYLIKLSLETIKTIKINISIAMIVNIVSITFACIGSLIPITGAIIHNGTLIIVIANAALLYDRKIK